MARVRREGRHHHAPTRFKITGRVHAGTLMRRSVRAPRAGQSPAIWSPNGIEPLHGTPLLEYLDRVLPGGRRGPLPPLSPLLPDDGRLPGAQDVQLWLRGDPSHGEGALLIAAAIEHACRVPLATVALHTVAVRCRALHGPADIDLVLRLTRVDSRIGRLRRLQLARWLCRCGVHRRHVQVGVAMLGAWGTAGDRRLIVRLGILAPVTLYAVTALGRLLDSPEAALFDLAKQASGWGVVPAIHALAESTDPQVVRWRTCSPGRRSRSPIEACWLR